MDGYSRSSGGQIHDWTTVGHSPYRSSIWSAGPAFPPNHPYLSSGRGRSLQNRYLPYSDRYYRTLTSTREPVWCQFRDKVTWFFEINCTSQALSKFCAISPAVTVCDLSRSRALSLSPCFSGSQPINLIAKVEQKVSFRSLRLFTKFGASLQYTGKMVARTADEAWGMKIWSYIEQYCQLCFR